MIAADTSALVAIVLGEAERMVFRNAIRQARTVFVSTISVIELKMVVYGRRGPRGVVQAESLLKLRKFEITPPSVADMEAAFAAFVAFGKRSGHPAALNFGDLFSYALAKVRSLPLLFKGNDFAQTDIEVVVISN